VGLDALDVARIEAGFVLLGVDYYSSHKVVLESRKSTPHELGFGWIYEPLVGATGFQPNIEISMDTPDSERSSTIEDWDRALDGIHQLTP